jgi:hypothetical protein
MSNSVGKVGKRNRMAGTHPSYAKLNMSPATRRKKLTYDKAYQNTPERIAYRVELNKKNRELSKRGQSKIGDGKDVSHKIGYASGGTIKSGGSYLENASNNRARKRKKKM